MTVAERLQEIERFELRGCSDVGCMCYSEMVKESDGEWVKYEDVLAQVRGEGWIRVEERLPEIGKPVWCFEKGDYYEAWLKDNGTWRNGLTPTHWRPLPPAPSEEANNG